MSIKSSHVLTVMLIIAISMQSCNSSSILYSGPITSNSATIGGNNNHIVTKSGVIGVPADSDHVRHHEVGTDK